MILRSIKKTLEYHRHSFCFTATYGDIFGEMIPSSLYSWHAKEDKEESGTRNSILRNDTGGHPLQAIPADRKSGGQKTAEHESTYMIKLTAVKIEQVWCEMRESGKESAQGGRRNRKSKGQLARKLFAPVKHHPIRSEGMIVCFEVHNGTGYRKIRFLQMASTQ